MAMFPRFLVKKLLILSCICKSRIGRQKVLISIRKLLNFFVLISWKHLLLSISDYPRNLRNCLSCFPGWNWIVCSPFLRTSNINCCLWWRTAADWGYPKFSIWKSMMSILIRWLSISKAPSDRKIGSVSCPRKSVMNCRAIVRWKNQMNMFLKVKEEECCMRELCLIFFNMLKKKLASLSQLPFIRCVIHSLRIYWRTERISVMYKSFSDIIIFVRPRCILKSRILFWRISWVRYKKKRLLLIAPTVYYATSNTYSCWHYVLLKCFRNEYFLAYRANSTNNSNSVDWSLRWCFLALDCKLLSVEVHERL